MSSRYPPSDYRVPRDRSRSPPRFDRRASAANAFDSRPQPPPRITSDAPRAPRSQFDAPRAPSGAGPSPTTSSRPTFSSLRDAPPLGSNDRGRPFRERDDYRRDRPPSPRERSPPRPFKNPRDYPPRDVDVSRPRRNSRDGPLSAGATYPENPPFPPAPFGRGGFGGRGRGRGDFESGRGRGGRRNLDDRDLFRRDRSPPPRWGRDLSRDDREPERRDERRFDRREEDRRPDWSERDRDRDPVERGRRDQPPSRPEPRQMNGSPHSATGSHAGSQAPPIDPGRLALIESSGNDGPARRQSVPHNNAPPRREVPETPSYLNGRADATANRYNQRGSSPPTQAPPVPAFTLSFAPTAPAATPASNAPASKPSQLSAPTGPDEPGHQEIAQPAKRTEPPPEAPVAPKAPARAPIAPKAQLAETPPTAPRALRALELDPTAGPHGRLQGVRSLESLAGARGPPSGPAFARASVPPRSSSTVQGIPTSSSSLATLTQPVSPSLQQISAPTGPRASRVSPALASISPRPPFASPRPEVSGAPTFPGQQRAQTPPPPSGPRRRSISVSPKVSTTAVPTAPKADRVPPSAPRAGPNAPGRTVERQGGPPLWAVPSAPRNLQWNQWKRPPPPESKLVPVKRDSAGEEKERQQEVKLHELSGNVSATSSNKSHDTIHERDPTNSKMDIDSDVEPPAHSAQQSFFGQPTEVTEDEEMSDAAEEEMVSSSEDEGLDVEDEALFNAKFEKRKRELEGKLVDLSAREYRATTPLESIARLARISLSDLQRVIEHQEMDVDESAGVKKNRLRVTQRSDSEGNADVLTPKGEEDTRVQIRHSDDDQEQVRHIRRPSPEIINLPYLTKTSQRSFKQEPIYEIASSDEPLQAVVLEALKTDEDHISDAQARCEHDFAERLRIWRVQCARLDREQEEQENIERQKSMEPLPELDVPLSSNSNAGSEGRRLNKFSSEYIIEQVLKQSEETARIEQEKLDRKAKKVQADMEKEAILPDLLTHEEVRVGIYVDTNRYRDPESLPMVFTYLPPDDTFTDNERQIFIAAFKETPKKWGEIASLLPGRTYKDCIHHYYANKWDSRFKDRTKGKARGGPGRGRGRGGKSALRGRGASAMADLNRNEGVGAPNVSDSGRPKRAAAPTTFGEREIDLKATAVGPSPVKKLSAVSKLDGAGEPEKKKRKGEKPGRKPKSHQPLAALAAAPFTSPSKSYIQGMSSKEEIVRAQNLEDANLLAGLHTGHHLGMMGPGDGQMTYAVHDTFAQPPLPLEEPSHSKPMGQSIMSKSNASSYWSVPEQTDFAKYIAHFGTDFASIAAHMGTKTQTMIKNHFTRQVEGGNKAELEASARDADQRRKNGEDMGAPPTPTPIVKRKYDNPQPNAPRALAPHKNASAMDVDEAPTQPRMIPSKHTSPQQFAQQPRFAATSQSTPIAAPSPLPAAAVPVLQHATHLPPGASSRPLQHSLSSRISFLSDAVPDSRSNLQQSSQSLRLVSDATTQPPAHTALPPRSQPTVEMLRDLRAEQDRAFLVQQEQNQQERIGLHRQIPMHQDAMQSPAPQPRAVPHLERRLSKEEPSSIPPSRSAFSSTGLTGLSRTQSTQPMFGLGGIGLGPPLSSRSPFRQAQIKREDPRPSSVPAVPPPSLAPPAAPPEPPKRSNLMSILNSEPEAPAPKRESLSVAPLRTSSPVSRVSAFSQSSTAAPAMDASSRRDMFAQPPMTQSPFGSRPPFPHPGEKSAQSHSQAPPLKHELPSGGLSTSKPDWASHVHQRPSQPSQSTPPALDGGDMRSSFFSHRPSALSSLNQPMRGNPSPPPNAMLGHSRNTSMNTQVSQAPREQQRSGLTVQQPQHQAHPPGQPLQPGSYGSQANPPFHQHPQEVRNHGHHAHNSSLNAGYGLSGGHHRGVSRDDQMRHEQAFARDREEQEWRRRQHEDLERRDSQFRHDQERQQHQQQQQQQQGPPQGFGRSLPPAMHPSFDAPTPFGQGRPPFGLREASLREVQNIVAEQSYMEEAGRRRHEAMMMDREREAAAADYRRRHEEPGFRRTPLGGNGYGGPPPPPQQQQQQQQQPPRR